MTRLVEVSSRQSVAGRVQDFVRPASPLAQGRTRSIDVSARPGVGPINEQQPRPEMYGLFVVRPEVLIESLEQECLRPALAVGGVGGV